MHHLSQLSLPTDLPGTTSHTVPTNPSNPDSDIIPFPLLLPALHPGAGATATPEGAVIDIPGMTRTCEPSSIHSTDVTRPKVILTSPLNVSDAPGPSPEVPETTLLISVADERRRIDPSMSFVPLALLPLSFPDGGDDCVSPSKLKNSGSVGDRDGEGTGRLAHRLLLREPCIQHEQSF